MLIRSQFFPHFSFPEEFSYFFLKKVHITLFSRKHKPHNFQKKTS